MNRTAIRRVARMTARLIIALILPQGAGATSAPPSTVPADIRALLAADDIVLAFYKGDVTRAGAKGLVLVVYHEWVAGPGERDTPQDPCDLIVYEDMGGQWKESARSDDAVDCTNNQLTDRPRELMDMVYLSVTPGTITFVNQNIRSNVIFDFFYDKEKRGWYVQSMSQNFLTPPQESDGHRAFGSGDIASPHDFPLTTMNDLDAERLWPLLLKHTKIED